MTFAETAATKNPTLWWRLNNAGYSVEASSNFLQEPPYHAFDGDSGTSWTTAAVPSGWLRVGLGAPAALTEYSIRRRDDIPARNPRSWTFEGSNDGSTWTVLDTQSAVTWGTSGETKTFTFANATAYRYYQLNVAANNGDAYLSIAELSWPGLDRITDALSPADSSGNGHAGTAVGAFTPASSGLLLDGTNDPAYAFQSGGRIATTVADAAGSSQPSFSVFIRAMPSLTGGTHQIIHRRDGTSTSAGWTIRMDGADLMFYRFPGFVGTTMPFGSLAAGQAYSIGLTYDASTGETVAYLNGVIVTSRSQAPIAYTAPFAIGAATNGAEPFVGSLDEAMYWSGAALTAGDMADLHDAATGIAPPPPTLTLEAAAPAALSAFTLDYSPPLLLDVAAQAPKTAASFALSYAAPPSSLTLDATAPAVEAAFALGYAPPLTTLTLDAEAPSLAFASSLLLDYEPPVAPLPPTFAPGRKVDKAMPYPKPTVVNGRAT